MLTFGNTPPDNARGKIGVVVAAIYGSGEVANVVYYSNTKPLALVPRSYFIPNPEDVKGLTNSQIRKRTEIFKIEDNVEFEVNKNGVVEWIRKSPTFLDIYLFEDKILQKTLGVVSPSTEGQSVLWAKDLGLVAASKDALKNIEPNIAWTITVEIKISFGEHENSPSLFLDSFKPSYELELHSFESVEDDPGFVRQAPWMNNYQEIQNGNQVELESHQSTITTEDNLGEHLVVDTQLEKLENEPKQVKPSYVERPSERVACRPRVNSGISIEALEAELGILESHSFQGVQDQNDGKEILPDLTMPPSNSPAEVVDQLMSPELQQILESAGPGLRDRIAKMLLEEKHA